MSTGKWSLGLALVGGVSLCGGSAFGAELSNAADPLPLSASSGEAHAEASGLSPVEREEPCPPLTRRRSYAWQTLAADGAGFGLITVGGALKFEGPVAITATSVGVASLFLGGPLVHVAHGRWPIGVLDFGLRVTLPLIGGYVASQPSCSGECWGPFLAGLMIGIAPIWLDAGLLAWEDVPVETASRPPFVPRSLARLGVTDLRPTTQLTRRGFSLGLAASF